MFFFFFSSRRRHTRYWRDWSSDVCSSDLGALMLPTSLGLMLPEFEPEKRHVAIGLWAATGGIAAAAGPPLGGLLVQADWRVGFPLEVPGGPPRLGVVRRGPSERQGARAPAAP